MNDTQGTEINYDTLLSYSEEQLGQIWWDNKGTELGKTARAIIYSRRTPKIDLSKPYEEKDILRTKDATYKTKTYRNRRRVSNKVHD